MEGIGREIMIIFYLKRIEENNTIDVKYASIWIAHFIYTISKNTTRGLLLSIVRPEKGNSFMEYESSYRP